MRPSVGFVLEEQALDEGFEGVAFVWVEAAGGFELEAQVVGGAAFFGFEEELVGADVESDCDLAQSVEAGLGLARFIAAQIARGP